MKEKTSLISHGKVIHATQENYDQIVDFLNQNIRLHRHLDWFTPLYWLGDQPFLLESMGECIQALLCAVPENQDAAWVRTFGVSQQLTPEQYWYRLLPIVIQMLRKQGISQLAGLGMHNWFERLLGESGFIKHQDILVLEWQEKLPAGEKKYPDIEIRAMQPKDLPKVKEIDQLAFPALWQNSLAGLSKAFHQTGISTVALITGEIVGYQISTTMTLYGHLARLAVHPKYHRQGIAFALINHLLQQFKSRGFWRVTVNTQSNNLASLALYDQFGFTQTGEEIPVYELQL